MADDFSELINELSSTLLTIEKVLNVKNMEVEIKDLEIQASVPNLWDDPVAAQVVTTRLSYLQNELKKVLSLRQRLDDVQVLIQLATDEGDAGSLADAKNVFYTAKTGWVSSAGKEIEDFEDSFSKFIGLKNATSVSSGTAALEIAIKALGIKKGDEVIIPNFTIISNALCVIKQGATPVFVDCNRFDWNMKIEDIEKK